MRIKITGWEKPENSEVSPTAAETEAINVLRQIDKFFNDNPTSTEFRFYSLVNEGMTIFLGAFPEQVAELCRVGYIVFEENEAYAD